MERTTSLAALAAVALAAAGCGGGSGAVRPSEPDGTAAVAGLHPSPRPPLPGRLQAEIAALVHHARTSSVRRVEVYGPGSRPSLVRASSGARVGESARERGARFYLIVLYGRFFCRSCPRPRGAAPPRGTIETSVWSPAVCGTDFCIARRLPAAVSRLRRLATIRLA